MSNLTLSQERMGMVTERHTVLLLNTQYLCSPLCVMKKLDAKNKPDKVQGTGKNTAVENQPEMFLVLTGLEACAHWPIDRRSRLFGMGQIPVCSGHILPGW